VRTFSARDEAQLVENIGAAGWALSGEQGATRLSGLAPARLSDVE